MFLIGLAPHAAQIRRKIISAIVEAVYDDPFYPWRKEKFERNFLRLTSGFMMGEEDEDPTEMVKDWVRKTSLELIPQAQLLLQYAPVIAAKEAIRNTPPSNPNSSASAQQAALAKEGRS